MAANGMTDVEVAKRLDDSLDAGSVVDLVTTMGTATTAPVKVAGGSYAAQVPTWAAAANRTKSNSAEVDFTGLPAATIVGVDIAHADTSRSWLIPFTTPKPVSAGDTISFAPGAIAAVIVNGT